MRHEVKHLSTNEIARSAWLHCLLLLQDMLQLSRSAVLWPGAWRGACLIDPEEPPVLLAMDPALAKNLVLEARILVLHSDLQEPEADVLAESLSSDHDASCPSKAFGDFVIELQHAGLKLIGISTSVTALGESAQLASEVEGAVDLEKLFWL